eukprot:s7_g28.t1
MCNDFGRLSKNQLHRCDGPSNQIILHCTSSLPDIWSRYLRQYPNGKVAQSANTVNLNKVNSNSTRESADQRGCQRTMCVCVSVKLQGN